MDTRVTALAALACVGLSLGTFATSASALPIDNARALNTDIPATAQSVRWGWGWGLGGGLLAGAVIGGALAAPYYGYGYGYGYGRPYGYPAYGYSYGYPGYTYYRRSYYPGWGGYGWRW